MLVDAGFSPRQIRKRLPGISRVPEKLTAILVTHEHSDHVQGLIGIASNLNIPIYCNRATKEAFEFQLQTKFNCRLFETGASFEIGDLLVDTFAIPHDAQDPVGYLLHTAVGNIGFVTDLGHMTKLVLERIRPANVLVLESNHDVKMLQDCRAGHGASSSAFSAGTAIFQRSRRRGRRQYHVRRIATPLPRPLEPGMQSARIRALRHERATPPDRRHPCSTSNRRAGCAVQDFGIGKIPNWNGAGRSI